MPLMLYLSVATALTVYGIETAIVYQHLIMNYLVATALTVYGIETLLSLQCAVDHQIDSLQQHLPFTVLKLAYNGRVVSEDYYGCNSTYRLRY